MNWQQTWGYDPLHYAPILEDARRTGMRLVGLSPPDELLDAVARAGGVCWDRQYRELKNFFFAPRKCPIDLFGPVKNRTLAKHVRSPVGTGRSARC